MQPPSKLPSQHKGSIRSVVYSLLLTYALLASAVRELDELVGSRSKAFVNPVQSHSQQAKADTEIILESRDS